MKNPMKGMKNPMKRAKKPAGGAQKAAATPAKGMKNPVKGVKNPLSGIKMPAFLTDLYADMRDRKLLPVAGALLCAIIAVPLLVHASTKSSNTPSHSAEVAAALASRPGSGTAVVASNHGIRELRRRLIARSGKDPFKQQLTGAADSSSQLESTTAAATTSTSSGGSASVGSPAGTTSGTSASSGGGGGSTSGSSGKPQVTLVTHTVDVRVGEKGTTLAQKKDVEELTLLPGNSAPVFVFMGGSLSGKWAYFLLPGSLPLTGGSCIVPISGKCSLLAMKEGDTADVIYTDPVSLVVKTYRLKLDKINEVTKKA
jgi:hypothetical protein